MQFTYLYDPLCGWCYGASPVLQKIAENYPLVLQPTGLFSGTGRKMTAEFAHHAWTNDQRINKLTGQQFSEDYLHNILETESNFDSYNILLALAAVRQIAPEQEMKALNALQEVRYISGRDNTDFAVITEVLEMLGLGKAVELCQTEATKQMVEQQIEQGQQLASLHQVQGVPNVILHKGEEQGIIPNQFLYQDPEKLLTALQEIGK
ncbi:disulfide bond formation protein DsbA [Caviibacterium pharyngocola]|uniref:Disulfide bond formation protein DsbA n=1 Tax=Caviibacterium pharyngocola TaxID=28159 RepID=A0A2M8RTV2_9PAST|nr:disulfide bond formation protein DsbA [Caviibacterium pharyngocola]